MESEVEGPANEPVEVQTVGMVIRQRSFYLLIAIMIASQSAIMAFAIGNNWPSICLRVDSALYVLLGALLTLTIATFALLVSWILVDDCTWFFKSLVFFVSGSLLVGCGCYYFYIYFETTTCGDATKARPDLFKNITRMCAFSNRNLHNTPWTPVLSVLSVILGAVLVLYSLYILATMEET